MLKLCSFSQIMQLLKMKKWSSQWTQFMQLRKQAWKNNSVLNFHFISAVHIWFISYVINICNFCCVLLKTMANKSKIIRSRIVLLAIICNGPWQLWLVLFRHFSEIAVSFRSNRMPFCSLAYERYWDRHGFPWDFRFAYTVVPGPHFRPQ